MRVQRPPLGNWRIRPGKRRSVKIAVPRLDPGQTIGKSPDRPEATWERYFVLSVAAVGRLGTRRALSVRVARDPTEAVPLHFHGGDWGSWTSLQGRLALPPR